MSKLDPEMVARIRAAVASLPEPERSAFALHAGGRLDFASVAERLGIDVPEVERLLVSAILMLDRLLPDDDTDHEPPGSGA